MRIWQFRAEAKYRDVYEVFYLPKTRFCLGGYDGAVWAKAKGRLHIFWWASTTYASHGFVHFFSETY